MINVKLLVFIVFVEISESAPDYCEICPSHTLCLYKNSGPSPLCKSYDKAALLTRDDVRRILDKVNQRRNFVALGHARGLPSAANMNKVAWSAELAIFAQRWADQCDAAVRPAAEDICRDLADTNVGQNVATITGVSPGLKVTSFIEMWFLESLDYTGNVAYFNQSEESKTNHFTQLIWADTKYIGCGKVRFSIDDRGTIINRLVCNFAPRGNIQGKPIYTIGYPATQCDGDSRRDEIFSGLCKFYKGTNLIITSTAPSAASVSSLLRIVNLPIDSVNDDNLLHGDNQHLETNNDVINIIRHQKMRHITNNTQFLQHEPEPNPIIHEATNVPARHNVIPFQHTVSHSQNVHGAIYKTRPPNDDFRRQDNIGQDFRRHYVSRQCTRKFDCENRKNCKNQNENYSCTRRLQGNDYILTTQPVCCRHDPSTKITTNTRICECNSQTTCHPSTTQFACNWSCRCFNVNNCDSANHRRIPGELAYYDNIPDFNEHSNDEVNKRQLLKYYADSSQSTHDPTPIVKTEKDYHAEYYAPEMKRFYFNKKKTQVQYTNQQNQIKQKYSHLLINPFDRQKQLKRQIDNPLAFWQNNDYIEKAQLKSLRYTTLPIQRQRQFKTKQRMRYDTEPITIKFKDVSLPEQDVTEKFLSFDELMHFRRGNGRESFDSRRKASNTTTKKTTTTKTTTTKTTVPTYTTTLFKTLKHCSRKVTCTWTMPTVIDKDGKVFTKGRGIGSRTPPGYVEGCSRTSTCTREFMNRNKQPTSVDSAEGTPADEDYCERRSLDLQPRDSEDIANVKTLDDIETTEDPIQYTAYLKHESTTIAQDCSCHGTEARKKRNIVGRKRPKIHKGKCEEDDDLCFVILGKIPQMFENNKYKNKGCQCNASNDLHLNNLYYLLMFLLLCILY